MSGYEPRRLPDEAYAEHDRGRLPTPKDPGPADAVVAAANEVTDAFQTLTDIKELATSSLMVNVDFLELVDREGVEKAYEIVGKLKDLLGMTAGDWIAVLILVAALVLVLSLDGLHRLEERRNQRSDRAASDRRLRDELERQP